MDLGNVGIAMKVEGGFWGNLVLNYAFITISSILSTFVNGNC